MKYLITAVLTLQFFSCAQNNDSNKILQQRIDNLENKLSNTYKPGFGEFMSSIQNHHAKLWFAGQNKNWKLAGFEVHEIMEAIEDIQKYETERSESKMIGMINPALDSVNNAIIKGDIALFNNSYTLLTSTCNNCHHEVNFEFNVVQKPDGQFFSNQNFKVH